MSHVLRIEAGCAPRHPVRCVDRRVTYQVWWSGSCILTTTREPLAQRRAREVHGLVKVVTHDRSCRW